MEEKKKMEYENVKIGKEQPKIKANPKVLEELKISQEERKKAIIDKIIIPHEEFLRLKEIELKNKEKHFKEIDEVNKQCKELFGDLENTFGIVLRNFELKENIKDGSEEKILLNKLWDYILEEVPKSFRMPKTKEERKKHLDLKYEKHKEALQKIRAERNKLNGGKFFSSQP